MDTQQIVDPSKSEARDQNLMAPPYIQGTAAGNPQYPGVQNNPAEPPPPYPSGHQFFMTPAQAETYTIQGRPVAATGNTNIVVTRQVQSVGQPPVVVVSHEITRDFEREHLLTYNTRVTWIAAVLCIKGNWIFGIVALILASMARDDIRKGDLEAGRSKNRWSMGLSFGGWLLTLIIVVVVVVVVSNGSTGSSYNSYYNNY